MSKRTITIIVAVVLLGGIAGINYMMQMDPKHLVERGVGRDLHDHSHGEGDEPPELTIDDVMGPIGPENATVTVEVLCDDPGLLMDLLRPMFHMVERDYHGHLRFEFYTYDTDRAQYLVENVTGGRHDGLVINGEMIKMVPDAPLGMLSFGGSPVFEEWSEHDLRMAIEADLARAGVDVASIERSTEPIPVHHHEQDGHVHGPGCSH